MRHLVVAGAALGIGVVLAAPLSCRQLVGIGSSPQTDLTTSVCGLPYGTPSCASCAMANCCNESTACAADATCAPYASCMGQCKGDATCWARCLQDHHADTPAVSALDACMATACEAACGLTCGAFAGWAFQPDAADACQACLVSRNCSAMRACATSSDCDAIGHCLATCTTLDCFDGCGTTWGQNAASFQVDGGPGGSDFGNYVTGIAPCDVACGWGTDWRCVGHVAWPPIRSVGATYHLMLKDFSNGAPVAGASVVLCASADVDCKMHLAMDTTNGAGSASLSFQNVPGAGGELTLGLLGYLMITSPTLVDSYYYWGFPLSEAQLYAYQLAYTPDELQGILASLNVTQDPNRGFVGVAVFDCDYNGAGGVQVTLDAADAAPQAYTPMGVETTTTDKQGLLLFPNVPVGTVHVTATPVALGKPSGSTTVMVRKGAITTALVAPTP